MPCWPTGVTTTATCGPKYSKQGATAVIRGKKNRIVSVVQDAEIYKESNRIDRAINRLKRFRAVAIRHDKRLANHFAAYCLIAAPT